MMGLVYSSSLTAGQAGLRLMLARLRGCASRLTLLALAWPFGQGDFATKFVFFKSPKQVHHSSVTPAHAGVHRALERWSFTAKWIPACAGMTWKQKPVQVALALALCLSINTASALTVSDPATHAKLAEEISKMQKMFEELQAQKKILEDQIAAIGKMGQIALPNLNLDKLTQSITKTIQCTLLDRNALQALLPGVNLEDVNISSVCQGRQLYQNALFGNPQEYDALSIKEKTQKNNQIQRRRENLYRDNMVKALALADVTLKETEELSQAVTNLESSASSAKTQNDRLAVIAQGTAVIARGIAQSNQMLALMLKNQTMEAITLYAPPQSDLATAAEAAASTGD